MYVKLNLDVMGQPIPGTPTNEKAPRPPNRKKHDENMTNLAATIKDLEDKKAKGNERLRVLRDLIGGLRDRRERIQSEKADLEERLNVINKSFEDKKDAMQRLKLGFVVTSEEALDQQVFLFKKS
jgi:chromosome segregation ATPase